MIFVETMVSAVLQEQELEHRARIERHRHLAGLGARPAPPGRFRRALAAGLAAARRAGRPIPATPPRRESGTSGIEARI